MKNKTSYNESILPVFNIDISHTYNLRMIWAPNLIENILTADCE